MTSKKRSKAISKVGSMSLAPRDLRLRECVSTCLMLASPPLLKNLYALEKLKMISGLMGLIKVSDWTILTWTFTRNVGTISRMTLSPL